MTTQEQLAQIEVAIAAIEKGAQEYNLGSRRIRRAELSILYQERRMLRHQLNEESGGGIYVTTFDRR